jgi:hypothetical protein
MIISNEIVVNGNIEIQTTEEELENEFVKIIITKINGIKTQSDKYTKNSIIDNYQLSGCYYHYPSGNYKEYWGYTNGLLRTQVYFNERCFIIFAITHSVHNNNLGHVCSKYYNDPPTNFEGYRQFDENENTIRESVKSSDNEDIEKFIRYVYIDNIWDGIPRIKYYDSDYVQEVEEPIDGPLWVLPDHDLYVFENAINHLEA